MLHKNVLFGLLALNLSQSYMLFFILSESASRTLSKYYRAIVLLSIGRNILLGFLIVENTFSQWLQLE